MSLSRCLHRTYIGIAGSKRAAACMPILSVATETNLQNGISVSQHDN